MAMRDSVTVSIAADTIGMASEMSGVNRRRGVGLVGQHVADAAGISITSSNVSPSRPNFRAEASGALFIVEEVIRVVHRSVPRVRRRDPPAYRRRIEPISCPRRRDRGGHMGDRVEAIVERADARREGRAHRRASTCGTARASSGSASGA